MRGSLLQLQNCYQCGPCKKKPQEMAHVCCTVLSNIPYAKFSLKFTGTSIVSLDPETVQLLAFYILSAMFTGACGPPEKLSLALVQRLNVLCMWSSPTFTITTCRITKVPQFYYSFSRNCPLVNGTVFHSVCQV